MPGAQRTRSLVCEMKKHTSIVTTVTPETPGIPRAMVLTVSFVLAPETGFVASASGATRKRCHQISAPGYQAHTTSPSARLRSRQPRTLRPSHPVSTSVTIASRPSCETRWGGLVEMICPTGKTKYFSGKDWTDGIRLKGRSKSNFSRKLPRSGGSPDIRRISRVPPRSSTAAPSESYFARYLSKNAVSSPKCSFVSGASGSPAYCACDCPSNTWRSATTPA